MNKKTPVLSPASFVTFYSPHTKVKHEHGNSILTELLIQDEPMGAYSKQIQSLRQRFNGMYYKFVEKLASVNSYEHLSEAQQEDLHSLFDELVEMRTLLEQEPISTR